MMKLLLCSKLFYLQTRGSRNSVAIFRKRRSVLKDFRVQETNDDTNIYKRISAPINKIVPVNSDKTSITIDILGTETFPKITNWRQRNLVRRARRVLPLPISLTTDDQIGKIWKQRFIDSIGNDNKLSKREKMFNQIPDFVKLMMEKDPELLRNAFPQIYNSYKELLLRIEKEESALKTKSSIENNVPYFPFGSKLNINNESENQDIKLNQQYNDELLDQEYENYIKHNQVLQYFASNLKEIKSKEVNSEIEGWSSQFWLRNYGKPDSSIKPSKVPCSGCGAHLHCVATNIPGFIPSEKFTLFDEKELHQQLCQRCDFLRRYNVALNVIVPTDEYPQLIKSIQSSKSMVIILVDLLDFPCSVWPGIVNLIGEKHNIYIVGNKVDLLPKDDKMYFERIRKSLKESLKLSGIGREAKIRDVSLISAKTGYGVENLVTKLLRDLRKDEQIYLIGCTNSGKSTLFNVLMQTDLCLLRDSDLVTRATTSLWPGTTLNLLKFPIRKFKGWEMQMRINRLNINEKNDIAERRLTWTMRRQENPSFVQLSERIGTSFQQNLPTSIPADHPFVKTTNTKLKPFDDQLSKNYPNSLYDTPGVIYKDQILNLLTTEELLRVIPREIITPRTYTIRPGQSLFIGGLSRLDLVHSRQNVWFTIFASRYLPVHIVYTEMAHKFYDQYVGTELLSVPMGDNKRLETWPRLQPKEFTIDTIGWEESAVDIVCSNAGWVSVTSGADMKCIVRAFTPEGRGLFLRDPPMLPYAIRLRGKRILNTPCFENKLYSVDQLTAGLIPRRFNRYQSEHINSNRINHAINFIRKS